MSFTPLIPFLKNWKKKESSKTRVPGQNKNEFKMVANLSENVICSPRYLSLPLFLASDDLIIIML